MMYVQDSGKDYVRCVLKEYGMETEWRLLWLC